MASPASVVVRATGPADLSGLTALVERCSPETLNRRFHGATGRPLARELLRVAAPSDRHRSWVALSGEGAVRGTASLAWGRDGQAEIAVLVEDAWFRRGVGRRLVHRLAAAAAQAGESCVVAWVQADNERALRFLRAVAPGVHPAFSDGEVVVRIPVRPATPAVFPPPGSPAPLVAAGRHEAA